MGGVTERVGKLVQRGQGLQFTRVCSYVFNAILCIFCAGQIQSEQKKNCVRLRRHIHQLFDFHFFRSNYKTKIQDTITNINPFGLWAGYATHKGVYFRVGNYYKLLMKIMNLRFFAISAWYIRYIPMKTFLSISILI